MSPNQQPEQEARDQIDANLAASGWIVQDMNEMNLAAGSGVVVRWWLGAVGEGGYHRARR